MLSLQTKNGALLSNLNRCYEMPTFRPRPNIKKSLRSLVGDKLLSITQTLSHRANVDGFPLNYLYFHGRCSVELHSLVPRVRRTHLHFPNMSLIRNKFPKTAAMCTGYLSACFLHYCNPKLFQVESQPVNVYLSFILS